MNNCVNTYLKMLQVNQKLFFGLANPRSMKVVFGRSLFRMSRQ